ncbi:MAG TPA: hypothetical protein VL946_01705, partial [Lacibacter sp.]|nr:hypothetical protein [Lacibacter sp.]
MNKPALLIFAVIYIICFTTNAQKTTAQKFSCEVSTKNATHVASITNNRIVVITGSTYAFTVDTHAD